MLCEQKQEGGAAEGDGGDIRPAHAPHFWQHTCSASSNWTPKPAHLQTTSSTADAALCTLRSPLLAAPPFPPRPTTLTNTGKQRRWDVIEAHSSVAVVLYHKDMDAFLLVRQFRPAVYSCRLREAKEAGQPAPDRAAGEGGGQSGQQAARVAGGAPTEPEKRSEVVLSVGGAHCGAHHAQHESPFPSQPPRLPACLTFRVHHRAVCWADRQG